MKNKLEKILNSAANLLHNCEIEERATWFKQQVEKLHSGEGIDVLSEVATDVRSIIAGMGSFSDLSLQPSEESGLSEKAANKMKWKIVDELDAITEEILK